MYSKETVSSLARMKQAQQSLLKKFPANLDFNPGIWLVGINNTPAL